MKKHIVYITRNVVNEKIYVGRTCRLSPSYLGSGRLIQEAMQLYGKDKFYKEVLAETYDIEEAKSLEKQFINDYSATNPEIGYNITNRSTCAKYGMRCSAETIDKLRISHRGIKQSDETIARRMKQLNVIMSTDEYKDKMSKSISSLTWMSNGDRSKRVRAEKVGLFLKEGWHFGRK
jgi:group I intron endonuclease